jgi:ribose transport system ATP-binding protein
MRDGRYVDTVRTQDAKIDQIISMMVGRTIFEAAPEVPENPSQEVVLEVKRLNRGNVIKEVSFSLKRGEILGFAGLMGAGRTEVARAIFGADAVDSGEIYVLGKKAHIKSPSDAVRHSIAYLSEDRKRYGVTLGMDVENNIVLAAFGKFLGLLGWVNSAKTRTTAEHFVQALSIKTPGLQQKVKNLSGGNQQKVIVAREFSHPIKLLIASQPTRGLDVGSIEYIHNRIVEKRDDGCAVLLVSPELDEILSLSDRIAVMYEGQIIAILPAEEATKERLGLLMAGVREEASAQAAA